MKNNKYLFYCTLLMTMFFSNPMMSQSSDGEATLEIFDRTDTLDFRFSDWVTVNRNNQKYLVDTVGRMYPLAASLEELNPSILALDLSGGFKPYRDMFSKKATYRFDRVDTLHFDTDGLALIQEAKQSYLVDTLGQIYPITPANSHNLYVIRRKGKYWFNRRLTTIPAQIFKHKQLKILRLEDNFLTQLPAAIQNLKELIYLNLDYNQLTSLPTEIEKLDVYIS